MQSENKFLWVQGPFAKPPKIKKKYKKNWKIYKNPQNIYNLIFQAKCCFVLFFFTKKMWPSPQGWGHLVGGRSTVGTG